MRDKIDTTIDEVEYSLYPLNPFKAAKILTRLIRYGAKPLVQIIAAMDSEAKSGGKKTSLMDVDMSDALPKLADALENTFEKMPEDEIERIANELLQKDLLIVDGSKVASLSVHVNKYGVLHLLKLIKFGLQVNFSDFLDGALVSRK